ncbi:MAG: phenylalanine--tRNA ligase subunit beta [Chitinivibrionales bacterium]
MKLSFNWLKELVKIDQSVDEVADALTSCGLEVASVQPVSIPQGVVVAEVTGVEKHPNADRLSLCTVEAGHDFPHTVVCGAPNVREGMKAPLATLGTELGPEMKVKKVKIRGIESSGMLCSERELGLSEEHRGLMELPSDAPVGTPVQSVIPEDHIIEIELTPNRGDCLSILGVAREISAKLNVPLIYPSRKPSENTESVDDYISVSVDAPNQCPRYTGRLVKGITIKDSPLWLKQHLRASGIRPINNIVDVTNYILLLFGQPMHAFDYAKIEDKKIIVAATDKEITFKTLDDLDRRLIAGDLLIRDGKRPVALAGIMGGAGSEISQDTTDVFLECAYFEPVGVRKTSKRLDLSTDSSYRFERGVDPDKGLIDALDTAAALLQQLAGGELVGGVIDVYPEKIKRKPIYLQVDHVNRLLGISLTESTIKNTLEALNIEHIGDDGERMIFQAPTYRHDLEIEADLIEEVGRMYGYENIPASQYSRVNLNQLPNHVESTTSIIRHTLANIGLHEIVTNSMTSVKKRELLTPGLQPVKLLNPLNPDMAEMRTNLLGNMLEVCSHNLNHRNLNNRYFEIGRTFVHRDGGILPDEHDTLGILLEGKFIDSSWNSAPQPVSFYLLKGVLETLFSNLHVEPLHFARGVKNFPVFDAENATFQAADHVQGICGKVESSILKAFSIKSEVYFAQIDITGLLSTPLPSPLYKPMPRFPALERDYAFVVPKHLTASQISDAIYGVSPLVEKVQPFDIYEGDKLEKGKRSIAYAVRLRAADRTLTDKEGEKIHSKILDTVREQFGVELRSE